MDGRSAAPLFAAAGREWELEALADAWKRVEADRTAFVRIHGPAGIGKTHLLRVAAGRLVERGATVVEAGAVRDGAAESFALAAELARQLIDRVGARKVGAGALARVIARLEPLLDGHEDTAPTHGRPGEARLELADALADLLDLALPLRPVILLDDLDVADAASLELLRYLAARLLQPGTSGGCLVVLAHRDGSLPPVLGEILERLPMRQLPLSPLDAEGVRRFLASEAVVDRLIEATAGRPSRLEEVLSGAPVDLAARRLAQVSDEGRAVLLAAAVLGGRQPSSVLGRVAGLADPRQALQQLASAGFLHMGAGARGQVWEIAREADRTAVLQAAGPQRLAQVHRAAGEALEKLDAPPEVVARHFLVADPTGQGAAWAARAASQLANRGAFDAAIELFHAALLGEGLDSRQLHLGLSAAYEAVGDLLAALRHLGLSRRRATEGQRREARSEAARLCVRIGKLDQAERLCLLVLDGRTALDPDDPAAARAWVDQAEIRFLRADYHGAMEAARAGIADAASLPLLRVGLRNTLGKALIGLGRYDEAAAAFRENRHDAEAAHLAREAMLACVNEGVALHRAGDRKRAIALYREGLARGDDRSVVALAYGNLAVLYHETGAFELALEHYGSALAAFALLRRGEGVAHQGVNRARLLLFLGDHAGALDGVEHARTEAERLGNPYLVAQARLVRAEIALRAGDALAALDDLDFARSTFARLGNPRYRVEADFARIRALVAIGTVEDAKRSLEDARQQVERLGGADLAVEWDLLAAEVALGDGAPARALEVLDRARNELLQQPAGVGGGTDLEAPWRLYDLLARAREGLGQKDAAAVHRMRARTLLEELRERVPSSHRARFSAAPDRARLLENEGGEIPRSRSAAIRDLARPTGPAPAIVGESPAMRRAVRRIAPLGRSLSPVLLRGATGTGKALFAAALHAASPRAGLPLTRVHCVAGETGLTEELFGTAGPGAPLARGRLEEIEGGTLYLDEVADLPPAAQALLAEVLENGSFTRPGGEEEVAVDVRLLCASSAHLDEAVAAGRFRQDLFYLLKGATLDLPPLRSRGGDVALLATHFLETRRAAHGEGPTAFSDEVLALLSKWSWPGNVRELRHLVEAVALFATGEVVDLQALEAQGEFLEEVGSQAPVEAAAPPAGPVDYYALAQARGLGVRELRQEVENQMIGRALVEAKGNISEAARLLQMKRSRLSQIVNADGGLAALAARGRHAAEDEA